ncbi:MAG: hypothetical protein KJ674_01395 [Nanoarchaeota archaeon]|nr:hypothetical protein [Nanoarchaeota archaeon]
MDEKSLSEMRHEIIENTIEIENFLDELIILSFDMELDINRNYKKYNEITAVFEKYFLHRAPISKKFAIIREIITDKRMKKIPSDFGSDIQEFITIRNVFAHQLFPVMEEDIPNMKKRWIKEDIEELKTKYVRHATLYDKLYDFIFKIFYKEI